MNFAQMIASESAKSQHPWIESSVFEPHSQAEVLEGVLQGVREACKARVKAGGKPVKVVFDLDSTIFDVKPRTLRILKEFALTPRAREISAAMVEWSLSLNAHTLLYTLEESAVANKVPAAEGKAEEFLKEAFHYWRKRFFTHSFVTTDHPTPGAVDFVNRVVDLGAVAVYLTGRDWPGMGKGTQAMLEYCGFPVDPRSTQLIMKPNAGLDDAEFKDDALRDLRTDGDAVALFDNEPANFHVFEKNFPEAWLVFFHSNCSNKEARPVKRLYKIENFLLA
jgi:hypothetical protein